MRIAIAADHNGVALKGRLVEMLRAQGHEVTDCGTDGTEGVVDYPPLCEDVCRRVIAGSVDRAIVVGGSGLGEVVACNKIRGIRAGLCPDVWHAEISRGNNDANVLVLGAKAIDPELRCRTINRADHHRHPAASRPVPAPRSSPPAARARRP